VDESPRIYLAIDNCFASKRWTQPAEWAGIAKGLGVRCVEASADTEADPLFAGPEYLADWKHEVKHAAAEQGIEVVNLYSGHGTYATLGLGHPDARVRQRMQELWIKPMVQTASELGAGIGFFCHAFAQAVLQDPAAFGQARQRLIHSLAEIAVFGAEKGVRSMGIEQMYSPHQIPWTIAGARSLLSEIYRLSRVPFYLTIDTGHAVAQNRFLTPKAERLRRAAAQGRKGKKPPQLWLGTEAAHRQFERLQGKDEAAIDRGVSKLMAMLQKHPYLFSAPEDGDPYQWLAALGAYSPIVHLQQVTGSSSEHESFTPERNARGLIHPRKVLEAIASSYSAPPDPLLPPRCTSLYLTLEVFAGSGVVPAELLQELRVSVEYWRRYIPKDGASLHAILSARP
jgi:sugar phosphate isomerase/epimerase